MKRQIQWMKAAILLCGSLMFPACTEVIDICGVACPDKIKIKYQQRNYE